jgi:LPS-assembly protein
MRLHLAVLVLLLLLPGVLHAEDAAANLIADRLEVTRDGALRAEGHVVAWFDGYRLEARAITYDPQTDSLTLDGPVLITTPEGGIITGEAATLDRAFRDAVLTGARLVLDRQLQLAAARLSRVGGRYYALDEAAVTSCQVCTGRAPLWEIRAKRVIHDQAERQLYFDDARLLVRGVPVLWFPSLRLPDPTLDRAAGFLFPNYPTTDQLGFGIRLPYFLPLGPSRDLTLSPWLSAETRTLEFRYRQAFDKGDLSVKGALGRDTIRSGAWRGYLMADGRFDLGDDLELGFDIEAVSDPAFLLDYGISEQDRLASGLSLTRIGDETLLDGRVTYFETLREDERNASLPPVVGHIEWERRFSPSFGGRLTLGAGVDGFVRPETDPSREGRDMARAGLAAEWHGSAVLGPGLVSESALRLGLDSYLVADDEESEGTVMRVVPQAAFTLRWPLVASGSGAGGVTYLLEPIASLGWAETMGGTVPNEDSRLAEFDEGNLLALTRFPGADAVEEGMRATLGVNWRRTTADGSDVGLAFGRILRSEAADFAVTSGLSGRNSDWLLAAQVMLPGGFRLDGRSLIGEGFTTGRTEGRIDWSNPRLSVGAAYVFLPADPGEDRPETASEWTLDTLFHIDERWEIRAGARYDVARNEPAHAGFGIGWRNECMTVDLSLSRRYTSTSFAEPSTSFGLSVNLEGFSTGRQAEVVAGSCS